MQSVRCRGCRRRVGVANDTHNGVYCDKRCAEDIAVSVNEDRDDLLELLARNGVDRGTLVSEFGITKQRLSQVLSKRVTTP